MFSHTHCSDPLPPVSIKQDEKKAALSGGRHGVENSSFSCQINSVRPRRCLDNLALFRRITALSEKSLGFGSCKNTYHRENKGIPLSERMSSVDVLGHTARCCELPNCSLMWPSALWECLTNSEGQTWSSCIILVCMMRLWLTPQPLVFTRSCRHFYSLLTLTVWENLRLILAFHPIL